LAQTEPARERPKEGDLLVLVSGPSLEPLKPDDLPLNGTQTFAWPMELASKTARDGSGLNKVLLLRLDPEGFDAGARDQAAEGVVAYSAVCTHAGCDVTSWGADRRLLGCPCHYSTYDPKDRGKVVGGPVPRLLPALQLKLADGLLVVAKPFTGRAGFQQM